MLRWYRLYLRQFCMANITDAVPRVESRKVRSELPKMTLRELVTSTLARRDAAANQLRSREEFYAELKRLSATSVNKTVKISKIQIENAIPVIKVLREIAFDNLAPFPSGLRECKSIYYQVRDGKPYAFKVRPQHRDAVVAKLRGAGATAE